MSLLNLPPEAYYIARCHCHEWVLLRVAKADPCGSCKGRPEFVSDFDGRADWGRPR